MIRFIAAASLGILLALPSPVAADSFTVELGDDAIRTGPRDGVHVGDLDELGVWPVPSELVGLECDLSATSTNVAHPSVHPGNDLIVASATSVELLDVEREVGAITYPDGKITLSGSVSITLRMGPDERFSAGLRLIFTCQTDSTTTTSTSTTTSTTSTVPASTTTSTTSTTTSVPTSTTTSTTLPTTTIADGATTTTTTSPPIPPTSVGQAGPTTSSTSTTTTIAQSAGATTTSVGPTGQLPATGGGSPDLLPVALALVGLGGVLLLVSSKPAR